MCWIFGILSELPHLRQRSAPKVPTQFLSHQMSTLFRIITKWVTRNRLEMKVTDHKCRLTRSITLEENIFAMTTVVWQWVWAWAPFSTATSNIIHGYSEVRLDAPIISSTPARVSLRVSHRITNSISRVVSEAIITNCSTVIDQQAQSVRTGRLTVRIYQTEFWKWSDELFRRGITIAQKLKRCHED